MNKLFLLLICSLGFVLRLLGIDFGLPLQLHPDEWSQVEIARSILSGDLNPHFFRYSSLTIYQLFTVNGALEFINHSAPLQTASYFLAGRIVSALYGTATIAVVGWLGRMVCSRGAGLAAALFMGLAPEAVRQAHYATVDTALVFWMTLALAFGIWAFQNPARSFVPAAVAAGLAIGTKYTGVFVVAPLLVLLIWRNVSEARNAPLARGAAVGLVALGLLLGWAGFMFSPASWQELAQRWTTDGDLNMEYISLILVLWSGLMVSAGLLIVSGVGGWFSARWRAALGIFLHRSTLRFGAVVALAFFVTSPFVILDMPAAARDIFYEVRHMQLGAAAHFAPTDALAAQLTPTAFFPEPLFYWNWFLNQNGILVLLLSGVGAILLAKQRPPLFVAMGLLVVLLGMALLRAANKGERYGLPLLPILYVWASVGIFGLTERVRVSRRVWANVALVAAVAAPLAWTTWNVVYQNFVLPDTRVLAWHWLAQNAPPGSKIVRENNTPDLEHVSTVFTVIQTNSAFENKTLDEGRVAGTNFILVGNLRDWYASNRALYPAVNGEYERLAQDAELAASFIADGQNANGPPIWIYHLP